MVANHGPSGLAGSIPAQGVFKNQNNYKLLKIQSNMEKDLGKIKKNDTTDVVVRIDDFGGRVGLTIREFTTSEGYTGFTKSGTRIPAESIEEFKTMINAIKPEDLVLDESQASPDANASQEKPEASQEPEENTI